MKAHDDVNSSLIFLLRRQRQWLGMLAMIIPVKRIFPRSKLPVSSSQYSYGVQFYFVLCNF